MIYTIIPTIIVLTVHCLDYHRVDRLPDHVTYWLCLYYIYFVDFHCIYFIYYYFLPTTRK